MHALVSNIKESCKLVLFNFGTSINMNAFHMLLVFYIGDNKSYLSVSTVHRCIITENCTLSRFKNRLRSLQRKQNRQAVRLRHEKERSIMST